MTESDQTPVQGRTRMAANGRIVIPAAIREQMGVEPGQWLLWDFEDGVLRIETFPARIRRIQRELAPYFTPGVLASDELIAERREEARREEEEFQRETEQERLRRGSKIA